jgi:hypothetical protein
LDDDGDRAEHGRPAPRPIRLPLDKLEGASSGSTNPITGHRRLLRARRVRPSCRSTAEQSNELTPLNVEHGDFLPDAPSAADWPVLSLLHLQPAAGRPSSPWGKPEMF